MKETKFIEQNQEKWRKFESLLKLDKRDPDELSSLFIEISDDLSYARTFYHNRSIRVYLNNILQTLFYKLYKTRKLWIKDFVDFWKNDLPRIIYLSQRELLTSFVVFLLCLLVGVISSYQDPEFCKLILGEGYIKMTEANIESQDPMAVYKSSTQIDMVLAITFNNLRVAFLTFVCGIFYAIGTIFVLMTNGIMVGAFQFFFVERDLFWESFLTIWLHGTLEISSIVIAGGAGLVLGKGLLFPGSYSRLQALQLGAHKGFKLMLGISPIIVMAGIIESFLTRYTDVPDVIRGTLIFSSAALIIFYFILYPIRKFRGQDRFKLEDNLTLPVISNSNIEYKGNIKTTGAIFRDIMVLYKSSFVKILGISSGLALLYVLVVRLMAGEEIYGVGYGNWAFLTRKIFELLNYAEFSFFFNLNFLATLTSFLLMRRFFFREIRKSKISAKSIAMLVLGALTLQIPFFWSVGMALLTLAFFGPLALLLIGIALFDDSPSFTSLLSVMKGNWGRLFGLFYVLLLFGGMLIIFVNSPILGLISQFLKWNIPISGVGMTQISQLFLTFMVSLLINLISVLFLFGFGMLQYSLKEISSAQGLMERVQQLKPLVK